MDFLKCKHEAKYLIQFMDLFQKSVLDEKKKALCSRNDVETLSCFMPQFFRESISIVAISFKIKSGNY